MCPFSPNRYPSIVAFTFIVVVGAFVSVPEVATAQGFMQSTWQTPAPHEMASAGDIDGDGYDDVIIAQKRELHLYRGSSSGLEPTPSWNRSGLVPQTRTLQHLSVDGAGDVNGDGYDDVIVGDPNVNPPAPSDARVRLYLGSASGLEPSPSWTLFEKGTKNDPTGLGFEVEGAGDINGDGYSDVIVTNPRKSQRYSPQECPTNHVHVFFGSPSGLADSPDWTYTHSPVSGKVGSCIGLEAEGGGDINGDGYDDIAFAARTIRNPTPQGNGKLYVFYGGSRGLSQTPDFVDEHPKSRYRADSGAIDGWYGDFISFGDVNGDGISDILVSGAGYYNDFNVESRRFRDFLYYGSTQGVQTPPVWSYLPAAGSRHAIADVTGDGFADVVQRVLDQQLQQDFFKLLLSTGGGPIEPEAWSLGRSPLVTFSSRHSVANAGDVNDDGYEDLLVKYSTSNSTATYLYRGAPNPSPTAQSESIRVTPGQSVNVTLEASDRLGDPLTYSVTDPPEHGSTQNVDAESGELTYVPDDGYTGDDQFTFEVADPYGNTDRATVSLSVRPENRPPEFVEPTPSGTLEVEVGQELTFSVAAEDPDGDSLAYTIESVPDGASASPDGTSFSWRPTADQVGIYEIRLTVDDGTVATERIITISVRAGQAEPDTGTADASDRDVGPDAGPDSAMSSPSAADSTDRSGCGCRSVGSRGGIPVAWVIVLIACGIRCSNERLTGGGE